MSFRLAASVAAAALLCGCGGPKPGDTGTNPAASPVATAGAATAAPAPAGPPNAPVPAAGRPGAIPLDAAQRRELDAAVASAPPAQRGRLRYALAAGDDGKRHLAVYDGQGLPPSGRRPGKAHDYTLFKLVNSRTGEHYDPQQNSIVPPIPPPVQRDTSVSP
jgi:hypothetical protein